MTCSVFGSTMASVELRLESARRDRLGVDWAAISIALAKKAAMPARSRGRKVPTRLHIRASEHQAFRISPLRPDHAVKERGERQRRSSKRTLLQGESVSWHLISKRRRKTQDAQLLSHRRTSITGFAVMQHRSRTPCTGILPSARSPFCPANSRNQARMALLTRQWKQLIPELWRRAKFRPLPRSLSRDRRQYFSFMATILSRRSAPGSRGATTDPTVAATLTHTTAADGDLLSSKDYTVSGQKPRLEPQSRL